MILLVIEINFIILVDNISCITDIKRLKSLLNDQFNQRFADLQSLLQGTLDQFASLLFANGMITPQVKSSPTFDNIMSEVISSLKFKKTPSAVIEHCRKLLSILADIGGPVKDAALCIGDELTEAIEQEFRTSISFQ